MKLKNILLIIGLIIGITSLAQPPQGRQLNSEERAKRQTDQMVKDLGLTEAQATKVQALNDKCSKKMSEYTQQAGDDRAKRREMMQLVRSEKDAGLKEILTADQYKKYQDIEQKRIEERQQRSGDRSGGGGAERRGKQRGNGN